MNSCPAKVKAALYRPDQDHSVGQHEPCKGLSIPLQVYDDHNIATEITFLWCKNCGSLYSEIYGV